MPADNKIPEIFIGRVKKFFKKDSSSKKLLKEIAVTLDAQRTQLLQYVSKHKIDGTALSSEWRWSILAELIIDGLNIGNVSQSLAYNQQPLYHFLQLFYKRPASGDFLKRVIISSDSCKDIIEFLIIYYEMAQQSLREDSDSTLHSFWGKFTEITRELIIDIINNHSHLLNLNIKHLIEIAKGGLVEAV